MSKLLQNKRMHGERQGSRVPVTSSPFEGKPQAERLMANREKAMQQVLAQEIMSSGERRGDLRGRFKNKYLGDRFAMLWAGSQPENKIGIYLNGACDLPSVYTSIPMIESVLNGSCCFVHRGELVESRFDLLLQTLNSYPQALLQETIEKLKLNREYFTPTIFEPEFSVKCDNEIETFPTKVFILSAGGNIARTVYRHREHGFLVDPGGLWLNHSVDSALKDMSTLRWFRRNFVNAGRMKVEDFREKTTKLVTLLKEKTGAHVILYSYLTAEPGNMAHNYQLLGQALRKRLLEFNIAISELSRDLDFPVVDINRILKEHGVREMVDFVHFPIEVYPAIGQEVFEIMRDLGVFE